MINFNGCIKCIIGLSKFFRWRLKFTINRYLRLSFFTLFMIANLNAQSDRVAGKIRGRVVDANSNEALIGANIVVLPAGLGRVAQPI